MDGWRNERAHLEDQDSQAGGEGEGREGLPQQRDRPGRGSREPAHWLEHWSKEERGVLISKPSLRLNKGAHPSARLEAGRTCPVSPRARPSGGVRAEEHRPEKMSIPETLSSSQALFFVFLMVCCRGRRCPNVPQLWPVAMGEGGAGNTTLGDAPFPTENLGCRIVSHSESRSRPRSQRSDSADTAPQQSGLPSVKTYSLSPSSLSKGGLQMD